MSLETVVGSDIFVIYIRRDSLFATFLPNKRECLIMQDVLELIEAKKQEFSQLPFFKFLADENIDVISRLAWAPYLAFFAMTFKDVNAYALYKKDSSNDPVQELLNQHAYEDGRHWRWYLEDVKKLGFDQHLNFTDTLMLLWDEETKLTRYLSYNLFAILLLEKDPVVKLAIVEAIEATGSIALPLIAQLGNELEKTTKERYRYFSQSHANVETGHVLSSLSFEETERFLQTIQLTQEQKTRAYQGVEIVFKSYTDFTNEMMNILQKKTLEKKNLVGVG